MPSNVYTVQGSYGRLLYRRCLKRNQSPTDRACTSRDEDCAQVLPTRLEDAIAGVSVYFRPWKKQLIDGFSAQVLPSELTRQTLHTKDMLLSHPASITGRYTLYVKSAVLLGKVKSFNIRYRIRHSTSETLREEVQALDGLIEGYIASIPPELASPFIRVADLDPMLYTAHLLPQVYVPFYSTYGTSSPLSYEGPSFSCTTRMPTCTLPNARQPPGSSGQPDPSSTTSTNSAHRRLTSCTWIIRVL